MRAPFLSPDGRWIGFFDQRGGLKKVSIAGGPALSLCGLTGTLRGASWGPDETIVLATSDTTTGLLRVPAGGGEPTVLTSPDPSNSEQDHLFPSLLPGGRSVLFTVTSFGPATSTSRHVAVIDLKTGQRKPLIRGGSHAEYVETGHLIYAVTGTLWAVRFDLAKLEVLGDPTPVVELMAGADPNFSVSRQGTLVYVRAGGGMARSLVWVSRQGTEEPIAAPPRAYDQPRLSPDGTRVAVVIVDPDSYDIWTWDLARQTMSQTLARLTFDPSGDTYPVWTLDGRGIVFASRRMGAQNVYRRASDGTGADARLTTSPNSQRPSTISPDGRHLVFEENNPETAWDLMALSLDGTPRTEPLLQTSFDERNGEISPDGDWLAYESNESGQVEVYVRPFPNVDDGRYQVSTGGGRTPLWSSNGRELFLVSGTSLLSAAVQLTPTFNAGNPTKLFEGQSILFDVRSTPRGGAHRMYDVSRDGQRFLVIKVSAPSTDANAAPASIVVVQNWFEELKAKVP